MFKRFLLQLPAWAQPDHPVLRHLIQRRRSREAGWRRALRHGLLLTTVALVVLFGYQLATGFGTRPVRTLHSVLYWPLVFGGVVVGLGAMALTGNAISLEKAQGTWDSLRITAYGAGLTFQARWVSVFYMLRGPLGALFLARLVFVAGILLDLIQYYRGRYLDLLLSGITPAVSMPVGAVLLAATMTAGILQPLVAVGLDAAVGLLVSVVVRQPRYDIPVRAALGLGRVTLAALALLIGSQALEFPPWMTPLGTWAGLLFQSVFGDQGLRLLSLEESGALWADLPYGLLFGLVLLFLTLSQAWLAGRIVAWAARLAEHAE